LCSHWDRLRSPLRHGQSVPLEGPPAQAQWSKSKRIIVGSGFNAVVLNYRMGAVVENGTVFCFKKFAKLLINLKIIKIIIIKNKKILKSKKT
jgi:hypothetical protein